jgi:thymidylate synthase (FAD)
MQVEVLNHMGDDLTVVNAARCSFDKFHTEFDQEKDTKLIKYLAEHQHWTTFSHCMISFRIEAPIFVARQLGKHQVGLTWNEVSRRYISDEPKFYTPEEWRMKAVNVKQGSSDKIVKLDYDINSYNKICLKMYNKLLEDNVSPEQARMVLPQNMMTTWWWTGSLFAFCRVCKLRMDPSAQKETRDVCQMIYDHCEKLFPISWKYLMG